MTLAKPGARYADLIEFIRFVLTGGLAAIANLVSRYLLDYFLPFEAAVVIAYAIGMVIAFILFQRTIFGDPGTGLRRQVSRFVQVNLVGGVLTLLLSSVLARYVFPAIGWTFRPYDFAHFFGVCAPAISSYFLHKHYTYK